MLVLVTPSVHPTGATPAVAAGMTGASPRWGECSHGAGGSSLVKGDTMFPLSILDLSPNPEGGDAAQSFRNTLELARHGERWG